MNILLSAVGRRAYLVEYFKRVVHPLGGKVYATNTFAETTGMLAADVADVVPPSRDPGYIDRMVELCRSRDIRLLFSLHDWDAPAIARAKERFLSVGTLPVLADAATIAACLDKYETFRQMRKLGVPTPDAALTVEEARAKFSYPMVVKPRWGQGSIGLFKVNSDDELKCAFHLSDAAARRFAKATDEIDAAEPQVIVQPCLAGQEMGCDIVNDLEGKHRRAFVKRKFAMRSGETDAAESASHPQIEALAAKIAAWSRHLGCMDSDWMVDDDGTPMLIELNPRFGGGYPFTHCAGADVCRACVDWARGIDDGAWCADFREGVRTYKDISLVTLRDD